MTIILQLKNQNITTDKNTWRDILNLAQDFGWKPQGTELERDDIRSVAQGDYLGVPCQRMAATDVKNFIFALNAALNSAGNSFIEKWATDNRCQFSVHCSTADGSKKCLAADLSLLTSFATPEQFVIDGTARQLRGEEITF